MQRAHAQPGEALLTAPHARKTRLQVYAGLDWSAGYHTGEVVEAPQRTLDHFLAAAGLRPGFELLVVDVEGLEWEVLLGFSALRWRPRVVIVEIEDTHESFRSVPFLQARPDPARSRPQTAPPPRRRRLKAPPPQERFRRVRAYFRERGYREHWRDHINTVFVAA